MRPLTGGYYWLPRPTAWGAAWAVLTCRDVGHSGGAGHADFWPGVVALLAAAWGLDPATLARRLVERYAGLPRGRVSRSGCRYYLNHGDDAPVPDGIKRVPARFGLDGSTGRSSRPPTPTSGCSGATRRPSRTSSGRTWD